jgi:hypothetical protein
LSLVGRRNFRLRKTLGLLAAGRVVSLAGVVLAAGALTCWGWSAVNAPLVFSWGSAREMNFVVIQPGGVRFVRQSATPPAAGTDVSPELRELDVVGARPPGMWLAGFVDGTPVRSRLGFSYGRRQMGYFMKPGTVGGSGPPGPGALFVATRTSLVLPFWFLALLFLVPAMLRAAVAAARARREASPFACRRCGYDLRATPDRCPECGAAAALAGPAPEPRAGGGVT